VCAAEQAAGQARGDDDGALALTQAGKGEHLVGVPALHVSGR
jgi:hypothetical protein